MAHQEESSIWTALAASELVGANNADLVMLTFKKTFEYSQHCMPRAKPPNPALFGEFIDQWHQNEDIDKLTDTQLLDYIQESLADQLSAQECARETSPLFIVFFLNTMDWAVAKVLYDRQNAENVKAKIQDYKAEVFSVDDAGA